MAGAEKNSDLVGVGSSAGGIEARPDLVFALPDGLSAPVVLARHFGPAREGRREEIPCRRSRAPVRALTGHEPLVPGVIPVVPS